MSDIPAAAVPLEREDWIARPGGEDHIILATHTHGGAYWWTKIPLLDRLDALAGRDNLKNAIADPIHPTAV